MINFAELKQKVRLEEVCAWLGITLKGGPEQYRAQCPICQDGGDRAFVVTPAKQLWKTFCNDCDAGGDCIELVARVNSVSQKEAARQIAARFLRQAKPVNGHAAVEPGKSFDAAAYTEKLEFEHEAVQALGIPADAAKELGIGYSKRGIMAQRVVFPIRFDDGSILGFAGFNAAKEPPLKLPKL